MRRAGTDTTDPAPHKALGLNNTQSTAGPRLVPVRPARTSVVLRQLLELPDLDQRLIPSAIVHKIREERPDYWLRRAAEFEAAAPRPGQYLGRATKEELSEKWHECLSIAAACRFHAALLSERPGRDKE